MTTTTYPTRPATDKQRSFISSLIKRTHPFGDDASKKEEAMYRHYAEHPLLTSRQASKLIDHLKSYANYLYSRNTWSAMEDGEELDKEARALFVEMGVAFGNA